MSLKRGSIRRGNLTFLSSPLRMLLPLSGVTVPQDKTSPCHSKLSTKSAIALSPAFYYWHPSIVDWRWDFKKGRILCKPFFTERIIIHWDRHPREFTGMAGIHRLSEQCSHSYGLSLVDLEEQTVGLNDPYGPLPIWDILWFYPLMWQSQSCPQPCLNLSLAHSTTLQMAELMTNWAILSRIQHVWKWINWSSS